MLNEIKEKLMDMGLSAAYLGYEYMAYAILMLQNGGAPVQMKVLYMEIARVYDTSASCVERNIRTASKVLWTRRKVGIFRDMHENMPVKRPSNAEILHYLAVYMKNHTKKDEMAHENW